MVPVTIHLPEKIIKIIDDKVRSGEFRSRGDHIRYILRIYQDNLLR